MTCCKRHFAAGFTIALFVTSATLYLNLRILAWRREAMAIVGPSTLVEPIAPITFHQADRKTLERRSEEGEKHGMVARKKSKLPRQSPVRHSTTAKNVSGHAAEKSRHEWLKMVELERQNIAAEMKHYKFRSANVTVDSLIPERGGHPVRAVVVTSWRSGSTFLGDILTSHPATFYHYEPLIHHGIKQVRSGKLAEDAVNALKSQLNCSYDGLGDYIRYARKHTDSFAHNKRLWKYCKGGKNPDCYKSELLNRFCSMFPFHSMKTVRLRANLSRELLEDGSLNVRVLLLVRDPRGTLQSRKHREWCPRQPDCDDPKVLCRDLVNDYKAAKTLLKDFPGRFRVARYEDIANEPTSRSKELLEFFGFQMHPKIESFLESHTKKDREDRHPWSTIRDSKSAPYHWKKDLSFDEVAKIQSECGDALRLWGYRTYSTKGDLRDIHPVGELSL